MSLFNQPLQLNAAGLPVLPLGGKYFWRVRNSVTSNYDVVELCVERKFFGSRVLVRTSVLGRLTESKISDAAMRAALEFNRLSREKALYGDRR